MEFIIPWLFLLTVAGLVGSLVGFVVVPFLIEVFEAIGMGIRIGWGWVEGRLRGLGRRPKD